MRPPWGTLGPHSGLAHGMFSKLHEPGPLGSKGHSHTSFSYSRFQALETSFHIDVEALSGIKRSNVTKGPVLNDLYRQNPDLTYCFWMSLPQNSLLTSIDTLFLTLVLCAEHLSTKADYFFALLSPEASEAVCPFLTFQL